MKIQYKFTPKIGCKNVVLALALSLGLGMAPAEAQIFSDDFNTNHLYWQEFGAVDVSGTIWDGVKGAQSPDPNFAQQIDANITNTGQLTLQIFDNPQSNGSTNSAFDTAALYRNVTGDFDAKVEMPSLPPEENFLTLSLGAWTEDECLSGQPLSCAIHIDNIATTTRKVRFRDNVTPDEFELFDIPRQSWFRLQRNEDVFTGFYGSDGANWTEIGSIIRDYGPTVRVGLSAWNASETAFEAIFDNFEIDESDIVNATRFEWNLPGLGDWNPSENWIPAGEGPPNANNHTAVFGALVEEPTTVATNVDVTVNRIEFDNANNSYAISGLGSVILAADNGTDPTVEVSAGSHEIQTRLNLQNNTAINGGSGTLDLNNEIALGGNSLTIMGEVNVNHSTTGSGTVNNSGTLGTAGSTNISGGLISTDTLAVDLGENNTDFFDVTGTATLSGTLNVSLGAGHTPNSNTAVLQASSIDISGGLTVVDGSGTFSESPLVVGNQLFLQLAGGLIGDYNGDGIVNAPDYAIWRNNLGANDLLNRDPNAVGPVGQADYDAWKANFGNTAASGAGPAAVPEPSALGLLLLAALTLVPRRKA